MTSKRPRGGKTVDQLLTELEQNPDYVRRKRDQERFLKRRLEETGRTAAPVIADLRRVGLSVSGIGDLIYFPKEDYQRAIPVLLRWLEHTNEVGLKQGIARTLTVKWAKPVAARALIDQFKQASDSRLKWTIGNALDVVADDSFVDELMAIATDHTHGLDRQMIVLALGNMKDARVVDVLIDLLKDDDVVVYATLALGKLKATIATPHLRRLLEHPFARVEAKRALAKIEGAEQKAHEKERGRGKN